MKQYEDGTRSEVRLHQANAPANGHRLPEVRVGHEPTALRLVQTLCQRLAAERVDYCHWKSNNAIALSASADNDLDLLIRRADVARFEEILCGLGFKQARAAGSREMPGVVDFFRYDEEADKLIHVHAHYQLTLGHDMTKNYRLPIENPFLDSAVQDGLFSIPAPEFEFIVFVVRMILKHSTWDVMLGRQGKLKAAERREMAWLEARIDHVRVAQILQQHLPYIEVELFDACVRALRPDCSTLARVRTGWRLQRALRGNARRPPAVDVWLKLWRRTSRALGRRLFNAAPKYRLQSGGALIAIVGGDGAGKSTVVEALSSWLSPYFDVTGMHLGKPRWSWTTITVRALLKLGQLVGLYPVERSYDETLQQDSLVSPGYPWLVRETLRGRDRSLLYRKARRFAADGGFVILDRFPLPQIQIMDGPRGERFVEELTDGPQAERFMRPGRGSRLVSRLIEREESYYRQIAPPDVLIVLRVEPEIAVQRKPDENAEFVRERNKEIWERDWADVDAYVIDGSKAKQEVLSEVKALLWSEL